VKQAARQAGVRVLEPLRMDDGAFVAEMEALRPHAAVVVAFGQLLPPSVLGLPELGCINVHASLLPKYRGAAPIQWALLNGEQTTGVSVIRLVARMDAGDILAARELSIGEEEDAVSLSRRLADLGAGLLPEVLDALATGTTRPVPQLEAEATFAPRLRKADGAIRWADTAQRIARMVRALLPWPSAHTVWRGRGLKILAARVRPWESPGAPGEVIRADHETLWVGTGGGVLEVLELQLESRPCMSAAAFVRGHGGIRGERLGIEAEA
jgi:methionyl-tRNA formyltransferase